MRTFLSALVALVFFTAQAGAVDLLQGERFSAGVKLGVGGEKASFKSGKDKRKFTVPFAAIDFEGRWHVNSRNQQGPDIFGQAGGKTSLAKDSAKGPGGKVTLDYSRSIYGLAGVGYTFIPASMGKVQSFRPWAGFGVHNTWTKFSQGGLSNKAKGAGWLAKVGFDTAFGDKGQFVLGAEGHYTDLHLKGKGGFKPKGYAAGGRVGLTYNF